MQTHSDGRPELLFFLSGGIACHDVTPEAGPEVTDAVVDADVLGSYLNGRSRLLGKYNKLPRRKRTGY